MVGKNVDRDGVFLGITVFCPAILVLSYDPSQWRSFSSFSECVKTAAQCVQLHVNSFSGSTAGDWDDIFDDQDDYGGEINTENVVCE